MDKYSFLNAAHTDHFTELYDKYLKHPDTVEPSWRAFFQGFDFGLENGTIMSPTSDIEIPDHLKKEFAVVKLIDAYRSRGHLFTKTNPVRERRTYSPDLNFQNFGLEEKDLSTIFNAGEVMGIGPSTLNKIIIHLKEIYCDSIGIEYMYIRRPEKIEWIQKRLNVNNNHPNFTVDQKKHILSKLNEAVSFENFLHSKFVGQKRFSLEGGESLIPAVDSIIELAAEKGVEEFVMGMAHRGRLNTLINIFGKSARDMFNEFEGKDYSEEMLFDGDVKYHLGWTCERKTDSGKKINLNIAPNPSHLETVGAIVQGITRAKQNDDYSGDSSKVLPIIVHGDAAIAGQGLPYEIVQMAGLKGYKTGGTIHIVVNNQIGFTTNYLDARTSTYCTDVGKVTLCPIFHVNSDDVEAVVHASIFALEYRMRFNQDVFIDLLGYRKYGHNEGDEPRFTQPKLYKAIAKHNNPRDIYSEFLLKEGVVNQEYINKIKISYKENLEKAYEESSKLDETEITDFMAEKWKGYIKADKEVLKNEINTKVSKLNLDSIAKTVSSLPKDKKFLRKIERLIHDRKSMFFERDKIDWAMGEMLAYGSILMDGYDVRISGQDVERGTFSHRHAILKSEESEEEIVLLDNFDSKTKGTFKAYNSLLSEYGVLGFDYGYAMASPKTLTIWEAQFGDFSNGAQIVIDQYISAAEDKWKLQNGIVLFLPHGYEGQGAEHSSARMERFLQLCADDNMIMANCTTPSNLFHLLRRQILANYRKPLVVFTPKSLLRHPLAVSKKNDFLNGKFEKLIPDNNILPEKAKSLVFCSGKFYYDLIKAREEKNRNDIAIIRIEQIFPLPVDQINDQLKLYSKTKDIVWAQEEPKNMGPLSYLLLHFQKVSTFRIVSRPFSDSPASGSSKRFEKRHKKIIEAVFKKN
ncbi:MAG: 2-oxoglutarate dehydrogenase E1 component [Flavobacteriaceae bacterium]